MLCLLFLFFKSKAELSLGSRSKALQTDGDGEFCSFGSLLRVCGIQHRITCPHTSQQNGIVA